MTKNPTEENFEEINKFITTKSSGESDVINQARSEVQKEIDYRIIGGILDNLPKEKRDEFVILFTENSNNGEVLKKYLKDNGIEEKIGDLLSDVSEEIAGDLSPDREIAAETRSELSVK